MRLLLSAALLALATACTTTTQSSQTVIAAALADPSRPSADRERDADRKPAELLAFAEVGRGDKVADFIMGGGYFTRILAAVVGPAGRVYAYQPTEFIGFRSDYAREQDEAVLGRANAVPVRASLGDFAFAEPLDAIITAQNWHDLHLRQAPPGLASNIARRLYAALKPGGVLLVIDHVANADPRFAAPQALHRVDPVAARAEIEAAGFRFEGALDVLRRADDPHTASVFDPAIRGRTDQFVFRFRKPR